MGISDLKKKYRQLIKGDTHQEKASKLTAYITSMQIADEVLYVEGKLQPGGPSAVSALYYEMAGEKQALSSEPAEHGELLFHAMIPFPEEVEKVIFRAETEDGTTHKVVFEWAEDQDVRTAEGDMCAWASRPDIICEPNIGDYRQAVTVHKLRRLIMGSEDRLAVLRVPADRSKAFDMLEENADRLLALLDGTAEDKGLSADEIQLGVISYLNAALKRAVDFGREYTFDRTDYSERWEKIRSLLAYVDDEKILNLRKTSRFVKIFFMEQKYPKQALFDKKGTDLQIRYGEHELYPLSDFETLLFFIESEGDQLKIEGAFHLPSCIDFDHFAPVAFVNDTEVALETIDDMADRRRFDRIYLKEAGFRLTMDRPADQVAIRFGYRIGGSLVLAGRYRYEELLCPVADDTVFGYMYDAGMMYTAQGGMLLCRPCGLEGLREREKHLHEEALSDSSLEAHTVHESLLIRDFYWLCHFGYDEQVYQDMMQHVNQLSEEDVVPVKSLISRYAAKDAPGRGRQVWLVMDRPDRADDNGEAFFRYLMKEKPEGIDPVFLLQADAGSAADMRAAGPMVEPLSVCHCMLHAVAAFVLSSQMAEFVMNPFNERYKYVRDLCKKPDIVFLQHGVTHNHSGKVMSRYGRGFRGIVTNGEKEYNYFKSNFFHYTEREVWLTGFARFDRLYDDNKKLITIMPTWRKWLTHRGFDPEINSLAWVVNDGFEESAYFRFYEGLINDERLLKAAEQYGYHIAMLPHVTFLKLSQLFRHPDQVTVYEYEEPYRKVFAESALVVTDYTSAVFDFAYLHKPIVYCQFDKDEFYTRHTVKKGYYDFERDGFGEVTYDKDSCVDTIIDYMKNECRLKDVYRNRIDTFFTYVDDHCCERLLKKLLETGKEHAV